MWNEHFFCKKLLLENQFFILKSWNRGNWRWRLSDHHGHVQGPRWTISCYLGKFTHRQRSLQVSPLLLRPGLWCSCSRHLGVAVPVVVEGRWAGVPHPLKAMPCHSHFSPCLSASRVSQEDPSVCPFLLEYSVKDSPKCNSSIFHLRNIYMHMCDPYSYIWCLLDFPLLKHKAKIDSAQQPWWKPQTINQYVY